MFLTERFDKPMQPSINDTLALIRELHKNQKDQSGNPYVEHPIRVKNTLVTLFPNASEDMIHAALLHDTIEDCDIDEDFLRIKGYSEDCIEMVRILSKPKDDQRPYDQVIEELINTGNSGAIKIKIADNTDNLDPDRLQKLREQTPQKAEKLESRYTASIEKLRAAIGNNSEMKLTI